MKSRLELALAQVVSDPETRDKMIAVGFEPSYASSKALAELIDKELPLMRAIGKALLAEGFRPVRGEHWHAASVRNLLLSKAP